MGFLASAIAELQPFPAAIAVWFTLARNIQLFDFFAQGISVQPQNMRCLYLIASGVIQGFHNKWLFDFRQYPAMQSRDRAGIPGGGKIAFNMLAEYMV